MSITIILYILATVCFCCAAFGAGKISWRDLGFALLTLSLFVR